MNRWKFKMAYFVYSEKWLVKSSAYWTGKYVVFFFLFFSTVFSNDAKLQSDTFIYGWFVGGVDESKYKRELFPECVAAGMNTVLINAGSREVEYYKKFLDTAAMFNIKVVVDLQVTKDSQKEFKPSVSLERVRTLKYHPQLLAWFTADEPDNKGGYDVNGKKEWGHIDNMMRLYNMMKNIDTTHSVTSVIGTQAGYYTYINTNDWFMADDYVVSDETKISPAFQLGQYGIWLTVDREEIEFERIKFAVSGDYDGNGLSDIAFAFEKEELQIRVFLSSGKNFNMSQSVWLDSLGINGNDVIQLLSGDFDVDGFDDLALLVGDSTAMPNKVLFLKSIGKSFVIKQTVILSYLSDICSYHTVFTGSFLRDSNNVEIGLCCINEFGTVLLKTISPLLSKDKGGRNILNNILPKDIFSFVSGDFTGDGLIDIALIDDNPIRIRIIDITNDSSYGNINNVFPTDLDTSRVFYIVSGRFDNDRVDDIAIFYNDEDSFSKIYTFISTGESIRKSDDNVWFKAPNYSRNWEFALYVSPGDYNGDGVDDICWFYYDPRKNKQEIHVYQSTFGGNDLSNIAKDVDYIMDILSQSRNPDRPLIYLLQGHSSPEFDKRAPTYYEQRYMLYTSIIHGAKGVLYWTYNRSDASTKDAIYKVAREFTFELKKAAMSNTNNEFVKCNYNTNVGDDINYVLKLYGQNYYLFSVNDSDQNIIFDDVEFEFADELYIERVIPLIGDGDFDFSSNIIRTSFAKYEAKVFKLITSS